MWSASWQSSASEDGVWIIRLAPSSGECVLCPRPLAGLIQMLAGPAEVERGDPQHAGFRSDLSYPGERTRARSRRKHEWFPRVGKLGRPAGAVQELARDDVERKKFLKMAGKTMGTGAAATGLAAFIAACGSSSSSSSSSGGSSAASASDRRQRLDLGKRVERLGDLAIVNYALTLEYLEAQFYDKVVASGLFSGQNLSVIKTFRSEEHAHVAALRAVASKLGNAGRQAERQVPNPQRCAGHQARRRGGEPRRGRISRSGGEHQEQGNPRRGAGDPHRRGAPCGDAEHWC